MTTQSPRAPRRRFTPEQKFAIIQDIEQCSSVKAGLERHSLSQTLYYKWKRQLEVGVRSSLRNSKPQIPSEIKQLRIENKTLKEMVLNLSLQICELKKTLSLEN